MVLVEALVRERDSNFRVEQLTQAQDGVPESNWHVAWAKAYLTLDGDSLMAERWPAPPKSGDLRVAFSVFLENIS